MALENTHYGAKQIEKLLTNCRKLYFIGIGGISMSSLAMVSLREGFLVGGSDRACGNTVKLLRQAGITVCRGYLVPHEQSKDKMQ